MLYAFPKLFVKLLSLLLLLFVYRRWQRQGHRHRIFAGEAGIGLPQLEKAATEQAGADQQHQCQRDLRDNQQAAQSLAETCGSLSAPAFFQARLPLHPDKARDRSESQQHGNHHGQPQRKQQRPAIDRVQVPMPRLSDNMAASVKPQRARKTRAAKRRS